MKSQLQRFLLNFLLLTGCCILLLCAACSRPREGHELVVGMDLSNPPFEAIQADGSPCGLSMEIAQHLGAYLHRPVRIENMPFSELIAALRTDKVDLVISSMTDTPARRKLIAFSEPYLSIGLACLIRKNLGVNEALELNSFYRKVAVCNGTTGQLWTEKNLPEANIVTPEKSADAVQQMIQGEADAFIYDQVSVWKYWQLSQNQCDAIFTPLSREQWAVGLRLSDTVLLTQVNTFLKWFRLQGGFERLSDRYLSPQKKAFHDLGMAFPLHF